MQIFDFIANFNELWPHYTLKMFNLLAEMYAAKYANHKFMQ